VWVNRSGIAAELAAVKRVPINRAEAIQAESASSPRKRAASADFVRPAPRRPLGPVPASPGKP